MVQEGKKIQDIITYEIDNKKYTVITKCVENAKSTSNLYDIICKYAISQIN